jgi:poly-gamma-glutamate capsule biosynthesis protein CapA/YwtB (metallophosphatase superfamily)
MSTKHGGIGVYFWGDKGLRSYIFSLKNPVEWLCSLASEGEMTRVSRGFLILIMASFAFVSVVGLQIGCERGEKLWKKVTSKDSGKKKKKKRKKKPEIFEGGYAKYELTKPKRPPLELYKARKLKKIAREIKDNELSLVHVGDVMLWESMKKYVEREGFSYPFEGTAPLLQSADILVANHEGPISDTAEKRTDHRFVYKVPPKTVEGLKWAGFDGMTLATNHITDCYSDGVRDTIRNLNEAGIETFGAGNSPEQARAPWIVEKKGVRVAFLAGVSPGIYLDQKWIGRDKKIAWAEGMLADHLTFAGAENSWATIVHTPETIAEDVAKARKQADIVVVTMHMGIRYYRPPDWYSVPVAQAAAAAGADLVLAHHSHIWGPVQKIGDTIVVYGIGNFAFGSYNPNADEGVLVRAVIDTDSKKIDRVELFPTGINNREKKIRFQTKLLKGDSARVALEEMKVWSEKFDTTFDIVGDRAVIRPGQEEQPEQVAQAD